MNKTAIIDYLLLPFLIIMITFPDFNPNFNTGIDGPLPWVFNYFFSEDLSIGKDVVFPHGPLAFLLYPLPMGSNLIFAGVFYCLVKLFFIFSFLKLSNRKDNALFDFVLLLILCSFLDIQLLMIGCVLVSLLNYFKSPRIHWWVGASIFTALAFFIKSYVGIICGLLYFSFIGIDFILSRKNINPLKYFGTLIIFSVLTWLLMYGAPSGFFRYFQGVAQLASDNSAAAAYYPENNWWLLSSCFLLLGIIPVLCRDKKIFIFFGITILAFFAAWKHGMAREDIFHVRGLFYFLILLLTVLNIYINKYEKLVFLISISILSLFYANMRNAIYFNELKLPFFNGVNHFYDFVFKHREYKDYHLNISRQHIEKQKIDNDILERVGDSSIDIYPWDYSYLPSNNLNWKPRPVIQSYAAYTTWLDRQNSLHFESGSAPEFILWEMKKFTSDFNGGFLESIDGRYLLNDEPETIISILEHYDIVKSTDRFTLFQRKNTPQQSKKTSIDRGVVEWNEWYGIPRNDNNLMRLKIDIEKNLIGKMKSFLYKDEENFIYYKLSNGEILKYKIVPKNAKDGLWINPFLFDFKTTGNIESIMFRNSNVNLMSTKIKLEFEMIELPAFIENQDAQDSLKDKIKTLEFENSNWNEFENQTFEEDYFSSPYAYKLNSQEYSSSFNLKVDTAVISKISLTKSIRMKFQGWAKAHKETGASAILTVERNNELIFWKSRRINNYIINEDNWSYFQYQQDVPKELFKEGNIIKAYVWNTDGEMILLDDLKVKFSTMR